MPEGGEALFAALAAMPQEELAALIAVCVARTLDGVSEKDGDRRTARLAQAVGLDMGAWWKPTAEGYFAHVAKATILEGAREFAPGELTRLGKLKKGDLASEAERLAAGTGWLPAMLREREFAASEEATPADDTQVEAQTEVEADEREEPQAA